MSLLASQLFLCVFGVCSEFRAISKPVSFFSLRFSFIPTVYIKIYCCVFFYLFEILYYDLTSSSSIRYKNCDDSQGNRIRNRSWDSIRDDSQGKHGSPCGIRTRTSPPYPYRPGPRPLPLLPSALLARFRPPASQFWADGRPTASVG